MDYSYCNIKSNTYSFFDVLKENIHPLIKLGLVFRIFGKLTCLSYLSFRKEVGIENNSN